MEDRLLSAAEVAVFLGVKRDTVYKLMKRKGLPARKVGRLWKFRRQEVDAWLNAQPTKQGNGAEPPSDPGKGVA